MTLLKVVPWAASRGWWLCSPWAILSACTCVPWLAERNNSPDRQLQWSPGSSISDSASIIFKFSPQKCVLSNMSTLQKYGWGDSPGVKKVAQGCCSSLLGTSLGIWVPSATVPLLADSSDLLAGWLSSSLFILSNWKIHIVLKISVPLSSNLACFPWNFLKSKQFFFVKKKKK